MDRFNELFAELRARLESTANTAYAHIPMDIRFLSADATWLSTAYDRDIVTVGCVTRNPEHADEYAAFDMVEDLFLSYGGRPHWAKRFKAKATELRPVYPRWDDFVELRRRMDPDNKLLNPYLAELFGEG
jgi:L-gulonolactone oxidase